MHGGVRASRASLNAIEIPFIRATTHSPQVTFNAQVATRPTTWGSIKSQYRN